MIRGQILFWKLADIAGMYYERDYQLYVAAINNSRLHVHDIETTIFKVISTII